MCKENSHIHSKPLHFMYKNKTNELQTELSFEEFALPFGGNLNADNRWVKLAKIIPWEKFEDHYSNQFSDSMGASALSFRIALGSLIIKERLRITDREAVEQITENPYLQYFLGFDEFQNEAPFDSSMYVHFRKRISHEILSKINEAVIESQFEPAQETSPSGIKKDDDQEPPANHGKLIIDATCTPGDIRYPTDISLLNEAREKTEKIIDTLWEKRNDNCSIKKKPRTYRIRARKDFLKIIKNQKDKNRISRKGIRKQLNYLRRNLSTIEKLKDSVSLTVLSRHLYRSLLVIHEVYRQQLEMFETKSHRVPDRIVSISQPHIRPIVRGKAGKKVEFGAKISASSCNGYSILDRISWDAYNEGEDLQMQAEEYKRRFGYFPLSIHADKIYRNRKNRNWCKKNNIRLSGPSLGRPKKGDNCRSEIKQQKKTIRQDELDRIDIEGRFGHSKRRYGLDRVMAKLPKTSESVISLVFLVMNLEKILRNLFCLIFYCPPSVLNEYISIIKELNVCLKNRSMYYSINGWLKFEMQ